MKVVREIFPQRDGLTEEESCERLGGSADITVDVYLTPDRWSAVEEVAQGVDRWADCDEDGDDHSSSATTGRYNSVDEYVCSARRRGAIGDYRRAVLNRCRRDAWPHLDTRVARKKKRVSFDIARGKMHD